MEASHLLAAQLLDTLPEPEINEIQQRQNQMYAYRLQYLPTLPNNMTFVHTDIF